MGGAGWRDRKTGPEHPLRVVRCLTHENAFTLYPEGFVPYGRVPVLVVKPAEPDDQSEKDNLVGAGEAACRGERWPDEPIEGDRGPVGRTQRRWLKWLGSVFGLDSPQVDSAVLSELGLNAVEVSGQLPQRVAALSRLTAEPAWWLRLVGAIDLVGRLGPVWVMPDPRCGRMSPARGSIARSMRGPPR